MGRGSRSTTRIGARDIEVWVGTGKKRQSGGKEVEMGGRSVFQEEYPERGKTLIMKFGQTP